MTRDRLMKAMVEEMRDVNATSPKAELAAVEEHDPELLHPDALRHPGA